ncbi:recombination mediator RecR [Azospirillum doebereinerae]|uniref:Recombination protein RecR n=1 Tax=Azospirillum doebereinerae TaxID=92933 RepID=A0A433JE11_9PROT|nr:recombination mediator RecR [Azospirillum doebereinerae]MCG5239264.1 recombination mediator RecR [Azospirillum doebereinerae]RUQ75138.1 recombination protein RecR [Azospirillum doebereinerae]
MIGPEIERLIQLLSKLPGLGPRSARRAALHLMKRRDTLLVPLSEAMALAGESIRACSVCGNLDSRDPCTVCSDRSRDRSVICVVEDAGDLWALERTRAFRGTYHVLGGLLSALQGVGPDDLNMNTLAERARNPEVREVILALNATVDGQTTAHVVTDRLADADVSVSRLAHGVPVGGELDYLDDGTLTAALKARRPL